MAVEIRRDRRDDRVERILKDPSGYFEQARKDARAEVTREMEREQKRNPRSGSAG